MICSRWEVAAVPFPFSDQPGSKRRPALVVSRKNFNRHGHTILAMITTRARAPWPGDTPLADFSRAGLRVSCLVRLKLFTLDNRLIVKKIGTLSQDDRKAAGASLRRFLFPSGATGD